jgi:hypothetical protein
VVAKQMSNRNYPAASEVRSCEGWSTVFKVSLRPTVLLLAVGIFGLAGCSGSTPAATPAPSADAPTNISGEKKATSTAAATAAIEPCSLLNLSDLTQYGSFTGPAPKSLGGARTCGFQRKLASASDAELGVSINVRDKQGISTVTDVGDGLVPGKVNGRGSVKASSSGSSACVVALAVGDQARVDVSITADTAQIACKVADSLANVVELRLPKS